MARAWRALLHKQLVIASQRTLFYVYHEYVYLPLDGIHPDEYHVALVSSIPLLLIIEAYTEIILWYYHRGSESIIP